MDSVYLLTYSSNSLTYQHIDLFVGQSERLESLLVRLLVASHITNGVGQGHNVMLRQSQGLDFTQPSVHFHMGNDFAQLLKMWILSVQFTKQYKSMFPFKGQRLYGSIRARPPRPTWNALLSECILIRSLSLLSSRRRFLSLAEIPDLLFLPRLDGPVDPLRLVFFRFLPATLMLLPPLLLIPLSLWESEPLPSPPFSASPASCREKCYNVG